MTVELLPAPSAASVRRFAFVLSWPPRFAIWLWALRLFLAVSLLTRTALCWRVGAELDLGVAPLLQIFGLGLFFDLTAAEWVFWEAFGSPFNFIAVDYLLYPHEVVGNIRESYPVGPILAAPAVLGRLAAEPALAGVRGPQPRRQRAVVFSAARRFLLSRGDALWLTRRATGRGAGGWRGLAVEPRT